MDVTPCVVAAVSTVTPSGTEEARDDLARELTDPRYLSSWGDIARGWLADRLLVETGDTDLTVPLLVAAALATLTVVVLLLRRRAARPEAEAEAAVFTATTRLDADAHRVLATEHRRAGRYDEALLDLYRAITLTAVERGIVLDSPDLTAREVGAALALAHPAHADEAARAGTLFDQVRYGGGHAGADHVDRLTTLDDALRHDDPAPGRPHPAAAVAPR